MSGQSLVLFVSVLAIALAASNAEDSSFTHSRRPSALNSKKEFTIVQKQLLAHTDKARGPMTTAVELIGTAPVQPGDVFVLRALVSTEGTELRNVDFAWHIPAGVEVVNGEVNSVIAVLSEKQAFETQITLRQVESTDARITFRARAHGDGLHFSDTASYNTLREQELEASRQALGKATEEYVEDQKQLKIFH